MEVAELLPEPYSGEAFPGYDVLNVPFSALESVVSMQKADWKAALENTKGVYLVTDTRAGKHYVGSAYGSTGMWTRWSCYTTTGHGFNDELTAVIREHGIEYARAHFRFAILEVCSMKSEDSHVVAREQHWKACCARASTATTRTDVPARAIGDVLVSDGTQAVVCP
jgi:hypothetical protein